MGMVSPYVDRPACERWCDAVRRQHIVVVQHGSPIEGGPPRRESETGAGFHGLSPLQTPTDAGYFYFQAVSWGSGLNPSAQGAAAWRDRVFPRRLLPMTTGSMLNE